LAHECGVLAASALQTLFEVLFARSENCTALPSVRLISEEYFRVTGAADASKRSL
jgi:hypothetical protein